MACEVERGERGVCERDREEEDQCHTASTGKPRLQEQLQWRASIKKKRNEDVSVKRGNLYGKQDKGGAART